MARTLLTLAARLAVCAVVGWWVATRIGSAWGTPYGVISALLVAVVAGLLATGPLMALAGHAYAGLRHANWREAEGRYYAWRGRRIHVVEDDDGQRWIRLADVRAVVGFTASDASLRVVYPHAWERLGRRGEPHLRDDALLVHLRKERSPEAARWVTWIEREIAFPGRQRRMRSTSAVVE